MLPRPSRVLRAVETLIVGWLSQVAYQIMTFLCCEVHKVASELLTLYLRAVQLDFGLHRNLSRLLGGLLTGRKNHFCLRSADFRGKSGLSGRGGLFVEKFFYFGRHILTV